MKKWITNIAIVLMVMAITATVAHLLGVKDWDTCLSAGAGAGVASLLSIRWKQKKLSAN